MTTTVTTAETGPLTANGATPLPFKFQAISPAEVEVLRNGVLVSGSTFTVTLNPDGTGTVSPLTSWGSDEIYIRSAPNFQQPTQFERFIALFPDQLNAPLDRMARSILALKASAARFGLSASANRAGGYLSWDVNGDPVVSSGTGADAGLRADLAAGGGAGLVGFVQSLTGAVVRAFSSKAQDTVCIFDFMSAAQIADVRSNAATLDVTTAVQNALNSGKMLYAPAGTYLVSTLTMSSNGAGIEGDGYNTLFLTNSESGDVFTLGDNAATVTGLHFRNFRVWSNITKLAGAAFNARMSTNCRWDNVYVGALNDWVANGSAHRLFDGYYFDRFGEAVINGGQTTVANAAFKARGNADQSFGAELTIGGGHRVYKAATGVLLGGGAGGVYLGRVDLSECGRGIHCTNTLQAATINRELFLSSECTVDNCTVFGLDIESNGMALLQVDGAWFSGNATHVRVATASGVSAKWNGIRAKSASGSGIDISSGSHVFNGGMCSNNGNNGSGASGINAAAFSALTISGMQIDNNGNALGGAGLHIGAGQNNYNIQANNFFSNGPGGTTHVDDVSAGYDGTHMIRDNSGHVTENSGTAVIPNTATTVVVNHGLSEAPSYVDISFAGPQDGGAYAYVTPGSLTDTQFTITYSLAASADRSFWWRATRGA